MDVLSFSRLRHMLCLLALIPLFFAGTPAEGAPASFKTPQEAIERAQEGIDSCNYELFLQAVDIDAVVDNAGQEVLPELVKQVKSNAYPQINPIFSLLIAGLNLDDPAKMNFLRQMLASEAKKFVSLGITKGYFAGTPDPQGGQASALFSDVSLGKKQLVAQKILRQKGKTAFLSAVLYDEDAGTFPLVLELSKQESGWRVMRVDNAVQLMHEALQGAQ